MEIRKLEWDSKFFDLRIGRVDLTEPSDVTTLAWQQNELRAHFDLLYIFDPRRYGFCARDAELVDEKVLYSKFCTERKIYPDVMLYEQPWPSDSLYELALVSGEFSRFKLDKRFPADSYERMYRRWIENACPSAESNKQIFAYVPEGIAQGMITVDYKGDHAQIGLVAVDPKYQHQGVGTKIMSTLETYLFDRRVFSIEVATQKANVYACRWYEKNGYIVQSIIPIYHWWL